MADIPSLEPHDFWQELIPADAPLPVDDDSGYVDFYPARFPDGRRLLLPLRQLPGHRDRAVASLIANQASFPVEGALVEGMTAIARRYEPEVVVGLPTLGLSLARGVAKALGHSRYVPLGTSRKFWYREELSVPCSSITSPGTGKRLYVDPRMLPLLDRRKVAVVDDVISTGTSIRAALDLLSLAGVEPACILTAMVQTERWRSVLEEIRPDLPDCVHGVLRSPLFRYRDGRWHPDAPMGPN